jgi:Response regulators consisting of a CheY-like receiver domain and a winged-helix DNA-binding domain
MEPLPTHEKQKLRILIVEDHIDTAYGLKFYFTTKGHDVRVAFDVKSAQKAAEEQEFDILLSDLSLPTERVGIY